MVPLELTQVQEYSKEWVCQYYHFSVLVNQLAGHNHKHRSPLTHVLHAVIIHLSWRIWTDLIYFLVYLLIQVHIQIVQIVLSSLTHLITSMVKYPALSMDASFYNIYPYPSQWKWLFLWVNELLFVTDIIIECWVQPPRERTHHGIT